MRITIEYKPEFSRKKYLDNVGSTLEAVERSWVDKNGDVHVVRRSELGDVELVDVTVGGPTYETRTDEICGILRYENAKSISDESDLFPDFIEIRMENDENGGRKKVYIARETIKKIEIHEK